MPSDGSRCIDRIGVAVLTDQLFLRAGIASVLDADRRFRVLIEAATAAELSVKLATHPGGSSVVIVDAELRGAVEADVIAETSRSHRALGVVLLAASPSPTRVLLALASGARGLVLADSRPRGLVDCLAHVAQGRVYLDPRLGDIIVATLLHSRTAEQYASDRRLLSLMAQGFTDQQIGRALCLETPTVTRWVRAIVRRLEAGSRAAAVSEALRRGLLDGAVPLVSSAVPSVGRAL